MKIEKIKLTDKIFLLIFENQYKIASTFLRFQEYYESPKFKGKIFTLDEFKNWYSDLKGSFSYYTDWNGFNIPSYILKPFYEGKFNPLSEKEKYILDLFKNVDSNFYIIGIHKNIKDVSVLLKHEIAHGLFYTDEGYRKSVKNILADFDLSEIKKELSLKRGYHQEVLEDEAHAYSLDTINKLKSKIPSELEKRLSEEYNKAIQKNNISIEKYE